MATTCPILSDIKRLVRSAPPHSALALGLFLVLFVSATAVGCHGKQTGNIALSDSQHLDFNQDVQPILASNCFSCHGPDPEMRKAGLRLDLEESAFRKRPGHPDAIVPGHPDQSELIKRIESSDPHHLMPQSPQGEAKPMKAVGYRDPPAVDQGRRSLSTALGIQKPGQANNSGYCRKRRVGKDANRRVYSRAAQEMKDCNPRPRRIKGP